MLGNCLMGSRPLLIFDSNFDTQPHLLLLKEMLSQALGTPKGHPASKPFFDHALSFFWLDNRIWFRNYQVSKFDLGHFLTLRRW
jgi:ribosome biogenesis protein BRX1